MTEKQYIDVSNIEKKPELFLRIYQAYYQEIIIVQGKNPDLKAPQALADCVLNCAKKGQAFAQFLVKPENPILIVCRKENLTRKQLAERIDVKVSRLENCLSRGKASKGIMKLLQQHFDYIGG